MPAKSPHKKGQVVLFVIIVLTISLIIVVSVVNRSLVGQRETNVNTDSTRAFNAADSGIDELLNRDLAAIAGNGTDYSNNNVDPTFFSQSSSKYRVDLDSNNYLETKEEILKDTVLQIDYNFPPTYNQNEIVIFNKNACLLLSAYNAAGDVRRLFVCGKDQPDIQDDMGTTDSVCNDSPYCQTTDSVFNAATGFDSAFDTTLFTIRTLLIKVLVADTKIRMTADNYAQAFKTKNIVGKSWATTKSGVKKEIWVETKTTKDIYPVLDYALYVR